MNSQSLLYSMIMLLCLFFLYTNLKNYMKNKKENMEILYKLNNDDKIMRTVSKAILAFMVVSTFITYQASFATTGVNTENILMMILPFFLVVLYLPLSKKTSVTTIGVLKRNSLLKWDDIKGIDYKKPDAKGKIKVKLLHRTSYNRDGVMVLIFNSDDEQLELFKSTAKEYRNKKKDKKIGK